ncbi:hypothetical protein ACFL5Z_01775 [Planctomycetota bacterium]
MCHDAGASVNMKYSAGGSSASMSNAQKALINTFLYKNAVHGYSSIFSVFLRRSSALRISDSPAASWYSVRKQAAYSLTFSLRSFKRFRSSTTAGGSRLPARAYRADTRTRSAWSSAAEIM